MAVYNYDVVVLGSGPAGEGAAMNAAKAGSKVAMVDSRRQVGGIQQRLQLVQRQHAHRQHLRGAVVQRQPFLVGQLDWRQASVL